VSSWVAALLGLVQGVFMFVPVSSTSHLALVQHALDGWGQPIPAPESSEMILFDLVLHVGTLVSIVIVLRRRLLTIALDAVGELRGRRRQAEGDSAVVLLGLLALATAVTGTLGFVVRIIAPGVFGQPAVIAVMLLITGTILWWTDLATPRGAARMTAVMAVGIGAAQALALMPGLSRSGLTIAAALALGLRRHQAAEFSFILAIPTILAATAFQAADVVAAGGQMQIPLSAMGVGFVVSAAAGVVALIGVLRLLYAARFRVFSFYVWALAALVLVTQVAPVDTDTVALVS
jgi:undecaprenyl-diphosphatase